VSSVGVELLRVQPQSSPRFHPRWARGPSGGGPFSADLDYFWATFCHRSYPQASFPFPVRYTCQDADDSDDFFDAPPVKKTKVKKAKVTKKRGRPKKQKPSSSSGSGGGAGGGGKKEVEEEERHEVDSIIAYALDQAPLWVRWSNGEETRESFQTVFEDIIMYIPVLVMEFFSQAVQPVRD
jgi:hypothetical protein